MSIPWGDPEPKEVSWWSSVAREARFLAAFLITATIAMQWVSGETALIANQEWLKVVLIHAISSCAFWIMMALAPTESTIA